jgi:hypothetical protein
MQPRVPPTQPKVPVAPPRADKPVKAVGHNPTPWRCSIDETHRRQRLKKTPKLTGEEERAAIDKYIKTNGVTRCPTVYVSSSTARFR